MARPFTTNRLGIVSLLLSATQFYVGSLAARPSNSHDFKNALRRARHGRHGLRHHAARTAGSLRSPRSLRAHRPAGQGPRRLPSAVANLARAHLPDAGRSHEARRPCPQPSGAWRAVWRLSQGAEGCIPRARQAMPPGRQPEQGSRVPPAHNGKRSPCTPLQRRALTSAQSPVTATSLPLVPAPASASAFRGERSPWHKEPWPSPPPPWLNPSQPAPLNPPARPAPPEGTLRTHGLAL